MVLRCCGLAVLQSAPGGRLRLRKRGCCDGKVLQCCSFAVLQSSSTGVQRWRPEGRGSFTRLLRQIALMDNAVLPKSKKPLR
jgi:hypothetical protein